MNVKTNTTMNNQNATLEQEHIHDVIQAEIITAIKKFQKNIRLSQGDKTYRPYDTDEVGNKYYDDRTFCDIVVDMQLYYKSKPIFFIEVKSTRATDYRKTLRQIVKYKANEYGLEKWKSLWKSQLKAKGGSLYNRQDEETKINSKWWFVIGIYQDEPKAYYNDLDKLMTEVPLVVLVGDDGRDGGYQYYRFKNIRELKLTIGAYSIDSFDKILPIEETLIFDEWDCLPNDAIFPTEAENDDQQTLLLEPTPTHTPEPQPTHTPEPTPTHTPEDTPTHTPEDTPEPKVKLRYFKGSGSKLLTDEEKQIIQEMYNNRATKKAIADRLGFSYSTLNRLCYDPSYPDYQFMSQLFNDEVMIDTVKPLGFWAKIKHWFS